MSKFLSYAQFIKDMEEFKKSGSKSGEKFNYFDTPSHKFFKILFYFGDLTYTANLMGDSNGLLHPTWEIFNEKSTQETDDDVSIGEKLTSTKLSSPKSLESNELHYYDYNSAWSYLKLNDENERADKLEKFVNLLSNINSLSPWYFTSISGLDSALERKPAEDGKFELDESKKLTINCLPDSFDNRIGTLLELYRDITWSWSNKREVIPANLRKFDMAIYIYESPIATWHNVSEENSDVLDSKTGYNTSYKMLEFHDCEFNYNSIKSGWSELNNQTGTTPTYNIEISYKDCYEVSYNEFILRKIGDIISTDTYQAIINAEDGFNSNSKYLSEVKPIDNRIIEEFNKRASNSASELISRFKEENELNNKPTGSERGFLSTALSEIVGHVTGHVSNKIKSAILGNLYTYSITEMASQLSALAKGKITQTGMSVKQYIDEANKRKERQNPKKASGNIFNDSFVKNAADSKLGNIFKNTIANNI